MYYSSEDILNVEVKTEGILNDDQVMQAAYVKQESELAIGQIISLKDNVRLLHCFYICYVFQHIHCIIFCSAMP